MDSKFIADRITELRLKKNVSEYQMSLDLGQSKVYVQGITSGRSLPSMKMFLIICEYFGIEPSEFFEEPMPSAMKRKVRREMNDLPDEDLEHLLYIIRKMKKEEK